MLGSGDGACRTEKLNVSQESSRNIDCRFVILDCRLLKIARPMFLHLKSQFSNLKSIFSSPEFQSCTRGCWYRSPARCHRSRQFPAEAKLPRSERLPATSPPLRAALLLALVPF